MIRRITEGIRIRFGLNVLLLLMFVAALLSHAWGKKDPEREFLRALWTKNPQRLEAALRNRPRLAIRHPGLKGTSPLSYALSLSFHDGIEPLLAGGADPDVSDNHGQTPLMRLASEQDKSSLQAAQKLLEHGADANVRNPRLGNTALHSATTPEMVELLIHYGADPNIRDSGGQTPLLSSWLDTPQRCKTLLDNGADVDACNNSGVTATMLAIARGQPKTANLLIDRGADIRAKNKLGQTALHFSVTTNNRPLTVRLLARGADPNAKRENGTTPIDIAVQKWDAKHIELLLDAGARVPERHSEFVTILHVAAGHGTPQLLDKLIALGVDPHATTKRLGSATHVAADLENLETLKRLTELGVSTATIRATDDRTPLDLARVRRNAEIIQFLQSPEQSVRLP